MTSTRLTIEGMSCGHCVGAVTRALQALPGVRVDGVEVGGAVVSYETDRVTPEAIVRAVEAEGFRVAGVGGGR